MFPFGIFTYMVFIFRPLSGEQIPLFHIEDKSTMTDKSVLNNLPAPPASASKTVKKARNEYKTHSCYVCGKVLSSTSSYYVHMKQHSGHKPYHCPMCDVSFCRKPYLEVNIVDFMYTP